MSKIKVLICDDHQIFIDGVIKGLEKEEHIEIVGSAINGEEALNKLEHLEVDLILMDVEMPHMNGMQVTQKLKADKPNIHVIGLTMHDNASAIKRMIRAGARGYLIKNTNIEELVEAIETVYNGEQFFKGIVLNKIIEFSNEHNMEDPIELLTDRELEILRLVAKGKSNNEIAEDLFISIHTVHSHRKNMIKKLGLKNTAELVSFAFKNSLLS